jgi:hypothetical protein
MPSIKTSALAAIAAAAITASDIVPVVDVDGAPPTTYKTTLAQLRTAMFQAAGAGWGATDYLALGSGAAPGSGVVRAAQGAIVADSPLINSTATWNAGGVTFRHILVNITDTASAAASLFVDYQVAGASKFSVRKDGLITTAGGGTFGGTMTLASDNSGVTVGSGANAYDLARTNARPSLDYNVAGGNTFRLLDAGGLGAPLAMGALSATTGTFSGALAATSGVFSGAITYNGILTINSGAQQSFVGMGVNGAVINGSTQGDLMYRTAGTFAHRFSVDGGATSIVLITANGLTINGIAASQPAAANGVATLVSRLNAGTDGVLGPIVVDWNLTPSAVGASRFAALTVADNLAYREFRIDAAPLKLNSISGGVVTIGTGVTTGAAGGEAVLGLNKGLRTVDNAGTNTYSLVKGTASGVQLGEATVAVLIGPVASIASASGGDAVFANTKTVRWVNAAGTNTIAGIDVDAGDRVRIAGGGIYATPAALGFYGAAPIAKQTILGSRGGNAALASLLTQLASIGLYIDGTTA